MTTGTSETTLTAPATSSALRFTHWTISSYPENSYRDAWGRSLNPVTFLLLEPVTATAHYLPATRDSNSDGVPDWYLLEHFGDLSHTAGDDSDADGFSLLQEYQAGTHPLYTNTSQPGGVSWADSGLITANLALYPTYTLRSAPPGTVNEVNTVLPGTVITTPNCAQTTFAYWTLDGVRQQDAWGAALRQLTFTMASWQNREAVAYFLIGDSDTDGVPDAYESFHYATLTYGATADTDGDGFTLLQEYQAGTHPLYGNARQDGGVFWADSALAVVNRNSSASSVSPWWTMPAKHSLPPGGRQSLVRSISATRRPRPWATGMATATWICWWRAPAVRFGSTRTAGRR